jgi:peptidoglycan/LPS O-acetylase OafA/YrhL
MPANSEQDHTLHTRPHFEMLDGLRGVAAVAVVVFHFMEIAVTDLSNNFITHAYLAVEFLPGMGLGTFLKLRLIRLHPLVVTGALLGLLSYFLDPFSSLSKQYGAGQGLLMFLGSCLMIPYPIIKERYYNLFHLNPPTWSLFYEYIANLY